MATKLPTFALRHLTFGKQKKNPFPKDLFNEIWLKIGDYNYIYITEIKIEYHFYFCGILGAKHFHAPDPPHAN